MIVSKHAKKIIYTLTIFMAGLSGFAQMPIFKRYYIADLPGLGWTAQFYTTHFIHYITAVVLIAFAAYTVINFSIGKSKLAGITASGYFKLAILAGLIITGTMMVYRNLPGVYLNHQLIIVLNLAHMSLCMMFIAASLYSLVFKKRWIH